MSIWTIFFWLTGSFIFLYFVWNRLKEDYGREELFSLGFLVLIGVVFPTLLAFFLGGPIFSSWGVPRSGAIFWLAVLGAGIGFLLGFSRFKFRFFEVLEAVGMGLLYFVAWLFAGDVVVNLSAISLIAFVVVAILIVLFYFFEVKYRDFAWYTSGRVGFSGLSVLGIFFLLRALVALFFVFVLSFAGRFEPLISGIISFLFFLGVFTLSRQK